MSKLHEDFREIEYQLGELVELCIRHRGKHDFDWIRPDIENALSAAQTVLEEHKEDAKQ